MSMPKRVGWRILPRLILWIHAISVAAFFLILWRRTFPDKRDRLHVLPVKKTIRAHDQHGEKDSAISPLVSIIVPARDEEQHIKRCVESLLEQDYDNYEVIVVDDGSTDNTALILDAIAHAHPQGRKLWILRLRELPKGWAGKPHAIHRGTQEARGAWLLFTDADTWHAPNALRSAITQAQAEQADLFTIGAAQELPSFWNRTLMPMAYLGISMLYPPRQVNDPYSKVAVANGQYILIRRSVYELVGGYARPELRATLLDDRDLAHVVKQEGFRLHFVDGCDLVHVHMYNTLAETWRGWRKNAYLGNRGGLAFVLLQLIGLPAITIAPFVLPLLTKTIKNTQGLPISQGEANLITALELGPLCAYRLWLNRMMNVPWYYVFTHPLAGSIFTAILGQSTWRVLTGRGVDWRGRQYHDSRGREKQPVEP
jgi:chlorobactene glucosyltransferase